MKLKPILRRAAVPFVALAATLGLAVGVAGAIGNSGNALGTATYGWSSANTNRASVGAVSSGTAVTAQATTFCSGSWWTPWVDVSVPASAGATNVKFSPSGGCPGGGTVIHVYFRELYPFGRYCSMDGAPFQWNLPDGLCTS